MAQLLWILKNYPKYIHRHVLHLLQSTNYIVLAKVTTQQDYSIDQSQSSYMDPQTQIKPKDVSLAHVSSNNQHLACFHCQDEAFEETMVGEEGGAVIIRGLMKFLGRMKAPRSDGCNIYPET